MIKEHWIPILGLGYLTDNPLVVLFLMVYNMTVILLTAFIIDYIFFI